MKLLPKNKDYFLHLKNIFLTSFRMERYIGTRTEEPQGGLGCLAGTPLLSRRCVLYTTGS